MRQGRRSDLGAGLDERAVAWVLRLWVGGEKGLDWFRFRVRLGLYKGLGYYVNGFRVGLGLS